MTVNRHGESDATSTAMEGVREYAEEMAVHLVKAADEDRWVIKAWNEAGYNSTEVDLFDLLYWLRKHRPDLMSL